MKKFFKFFGKNNTVANNTDVATELANNINITEVKEENVSEIRSIREIIQEIHDNFYTEVDRLLENTRGYRDIEAKNKEIIEKGNRLKDVGFLRQQEVIDAEKILSEINAKKTLFDAIEYFSQKYPQYKFITEDSVKSICDKYNLVYGSVKYYKGNIPEKNLQQIEKFSIDEEDDCYGKRDSNFFISNKLYQLYRKERNKLWIDYNLCEYEIAAPSEDFDMRYLNKEGTKLVKIPDPVVLKPVYFKYNKYYLIITAWGIEASDELVVNQKMN